MLLPVVLHVNADGAARLTPISPSTRRTEDGPGDPSFVCERVCTSDRLLRRMGGREICITNFCW